MLSTMQEVPLTIGRLVDHVATVHPHAEVVTATGPGGEPRRRSYAEVSDRARRLATALRSLGKR